MSVDPPADFATVQGGTEAGVGVIGAGRVGGKAAGVTSRMHERWLKAGMGKTGDDSWMKKTSWCELLTSQELRMVS